MTTPKDKSDGSDTTKAGVRLIKYMGDNNWRRIEKGDTFGGRLPGGLPKTLSWEEDGAHVLELHPDDIGGQEVLDLLLAEESPLGREFKDVTELKVVPDNHFQKRWHPRGTDSSVQQTPNMVRAAASGLGETSTSTASGGGSTDTSSAG